MIELLVRVVRKLGLGGVANDPAEVGRTACQSDASRSVSWVAPSRALWASMHSSNAWLFTPRTIDPNPWMKRR